MAIGDFSGSAIGDGWTTEQHMAEAVDVLQLRRLSDGWTLGVGRADTRFGCFALELKSAFKPRSRVDSIVRMDRRGGLQTNNTCEDLLIGPFLQAVTNRIKAN